MCIQDHKQERTNSERRRSYLESLAIPVPSIHFGHDQTREPRSEGESDVFIQSQTPQGGSSTQASLSPPKDSSTPQSPSSSQSSSSVFLNLRNRRSKGKERSKSRASRGTKAKKNYPIFFFRSPTSTGLPAQAFDFVCSFIFQMKRVMVHQHESPKDDSQISGMAWPATCSCVPISAILQQRGDGLLVGKWTGEIIKLEVPPFTIYSPSYCFKLVAFLLLQNRKDEFWRMVQLFFSPHFYESQWDPKLSGFQKGSEILIRTTRLVYSKNLKHHGIW